MIDGKLIFRSIYFYNGETTIQHYGKPSIAWGMRIVQG